MSFWDTIETAPLDMSKENLKKMLDKLRNQEPQPDMYIVCLEDWRKIHSRSNETGGSHFSSYLELLKEGKVRPV